MKLEDVQQKFMGRGHIEMTPASFAKYQKHMKSMPQFKIFIPFFNGYPVTKTDATDTRLVKPDGTSTALFVRSKGISHEQSSLF